MTIGGAATGGASPSPEDARVGYQAAVSLWMYEGTLIWSKYNAMLVANSVVLATTALAAQSKEASTAFQVGLSVVGLVLCAAWLQLTMRGFDNYRYWIFASRELEERHLSPTVATVALGGAYADGDAVLLDLPSGQREIRMSHISRTLTAAWASYVIIGCFAVLYVLLFF